jgi:hypothetical protein
MRLGNATSDVFGRGQIGCEVGKVRMAVVLVGNLIVHIDSKYAGTMGAKKMPTQQPVGLLKSVGFLW